MDDSPIRSCELLKAADVMPIDDSSSHLYSGILCSCGQWLLLVDFSLNIVKLCNQQTGEILAKSEELDLPWSVCNINKECTQIAVTLRNGWIQIMSVQATGCTPYITSLKSLKTPLESCRGVCAMPKQDKLVVSGISRSFQSWCVVPISNETTGIIHEICQFGGFGYSYLALSENARYVYISCYADKSTDTGVYGYSLESGENRFTYKNSTLSWPRGICTDKRGMIYICNQHLDIRSIHQLKENGEPVKIFRLDLLPDPQAICLNENQEQMFITLWGKNRISRLRIMWEEHTETCQTHEVNESNGSERPARNEKTLTQSNRRTDMIVPCGQVYLCASDQTKPNDSQVSLQKRTLTPGLKYHVFFCYANLDKKWVQETVSRLETGHGFICCEYDRDNTPGTSIFQFVSDSMCKAYKAVIVMSKNAFESSFVVHEIEMAMNQGFIQRRKFLVPVLLEDCKVPDYLSVLNYIDARDSKSRDTWWSKLLTELET